MLISALLTGKMAGLGQIISIRSKVKANNVSPLAGLHAEIGREKVLPIVKGLVGRFYISGEARNIVLVSRTARPCDVSGADDTRQLGVCLERLIVNDGFNELHIAPDDPLLTIGVHDVEEGPRRWTTGRTPLPNALLAAYPNGFFLSVHLAGEPLAA